MFSFSLVAAPAVEPVSLAEAKAHARIDTDGDDALVASLIIAARQFAEKYTSRAFITQTWQLVMDRVPKYPDVRLPRAPLQRIESVATYDDADAETTWAESNYFVDTAHEPGRLSLRSGAVWPSPTRPTNGMIITYVAGYGSAAANVPEVLKTAIKQLVSHWYEHRGEAASSTAAGTVLAGTTTVPLVIQALLDPYRLRFTGI